MPSKWNYLLLKLALVTTIITNTACTNLFSGEAQIPVGPMDHKVIEDARIGLFAPNIRFQDQPGRPALLIGFAFDGTLNDELRIPAGERQTIVSHIAGRVPGTHYYPGVGMQRDRVDPLDAALGRSMTATAEFARTRLFTQIDQVLQMNPDTEFRVFVTGFSRGAASARHFMNIVDDEWRSRVAQRGDGQARLRFYALLYDTVSTGFNTGVRLGLPASVNYSLHFVARDEPRGLFPVDIDAPTERQAMANEFSPRISTLYLPGAHSDVGASYANGIGDLYRLLTDETLSALGLILDTCFENLNDSMLNGKHDSRGMLDKLLRAPVAGSVQQVARAFRSVPPAPLADNDYKDIRSSLDRLATPNLNRLTMTTTTDTPGFGFTARRSGEALELLGVSNMLEPSISRLQVDES